MSLHPVDESTLIDLIHGLVPPDEREDILTHLRGCAPCEDRFRALVSEHECLRSQPAAGGVANRRAASRPVIGWVSAAAAAAVLATLVVARLGDRPRTAQYWIPVEQETTVLRSVTSPDNDSVNGALDAYLDRDAQGAVEELSALQVSPGHETATTLRDLFLASALVNAGRQAEATALLDRIDVETLPTQWRRQARWVRYLAWSRSGRDEDARNLLHQLVGEPGEIGRMAKEETERVR